MSSLLRNWLRQHTQVYAEHSGSEITFSCPFCGESGSHHALNVDRCVSHCFRCGKTSNLPSLIRKLTNVSFESAVLTAAKLGYLPLEGIPREKEEEFVPLPNVELPSQVYPFSSLAGTTDSVLEYLHSRNFTWKHAHHFAVACHDDFWGDSVMFPCYDLGGLRGWQVRYINPNTQVRYRTSKGLPVAKLFLGLMKTLRKLPAELVVVEGPMDVLGCLRAGVENVVCTFGKSLSEVHAKRIYWSGVEKVILFYDKDAVGQSTRAARRLSPLIDDVSVVYYGREEVKDPGAMSPEEIHAHLACAEPIHSWREFEETLRDIHP